MTTEQIKLLIENEDLEKVYSKCDRHERKDLTEYLLSIGVQSDEYMRNIPSDFLNASQISSYDISPTVGVIGSSAVAFCASLTSVNIPNSVTSIGDHAFYGCKSLTNIHFDGTVKQWKNILKKDTAFEHISSTVTIQCTDGITRFRG